MSRIIIPDMNEILKDAKEYKQPITPEYEKAVQEANAAIENDRRCEARAWINAKNYIAL